ncbi:MAG: DJ-1/PfpI family protein [Caldilineaceae bacterium]
MNHPKPFPILLMRQYVFVLWGAQCQEAPAALFVSEMRAAGLQVKLVGLNGSHAKGVRGMVLMPDLTLGQALPLAKMACCVILPGPSSALRRMTSDPRLQEFLLSTHKQQAPIIMADMEPALFAEIGIHPVNTERDIFVYPPGPPLFGFIENLTLHLARTQETDAAPLRCCG